MPEVIAYCRSSKQGPHATHVRGSSAFLTAEALRKIHNQKKVAKFLRSLILCIGVLRRHFAPSSCIVVFFVSFAKTRPFLADSAPDDAMQKKSLASWTDPRVNTVRFCLGEIVTKKDMHTAENGQYVKGQETVLLCTSFHLCKRCEG